MSHIEHRQVFKRVKIDQVEKYGSLVYQIPISESWSTIVTSKAERFYFNSKTKQSVWQMPEYKESSNNQDLKNAYDYLESNKDLLVCLLALVRGAKLPWKVITDVSTAFNLKLKEKKGSETNSEIKQSDEVKQRGMQPNSSQEINRRRKQDADDDDNDDDDNDDVNNDDDDNDDDNDDDDGSEFALDLSDLEDLIGSSDGEDKQMKAFDGKNISDPLVLEYITTYPGLMKLSDLELENGIKFIKLLQFLKIDVYSSYDLEIENIVKDPQYIMNNSNHLDDVTRRDLWDEYCRVNGTVDISNDAVSQSINFFDFDTPELQYIQFLNSNQNIIKFPKYHTDFNRQMNKKSKTANDQTYIDLCTTIPNTVRVSIYGKWIKWLKLSNNEKLHMFDSICKKLKSNDMSDLDVLSLIKNEKLLDYYDCFFIDLDKIK